MRRDASISRVVQLSVANCPVRLSWIMSVARVAEGQDEVAPVGPALAMVGGIVKVLRLIAVMLVVGTGSVVAMVVADEIAIPMVIEAKETEVEATGSAVAVSASDALWALVVPVPALVPILSVVMEASAPAHPSAVGNTTVGAWCITP